MCRIYVINYAKLYFTRNTTVLCYMTCANKAAKWNRGCNIKSSMAAIEDRLSEDSMCGSYFFQTKNKCLTCSEVFFIRCSGFEEDENTPGWKAITIYMGGGTAPPPPPKKLGGGAAPTKKNWLRKATFFKIKILDFFY